MKSTFSQNSKTKQILPSCPREKKKGQSKGLYYETRGQVQLNYKAQYLGLLILLGATKVFYSFF